MSAGIIINPIAGARRGSAAARRQGLARATLAKCGLEGEVVLTEGRGHAREIAAQLVEQGADTVVAWGGDGTINEVATEVAFRSPTLGIVPSGSGNGLARELDLDWNPVSALETALRGEIVRRIDVGEVGDRLFFNVAGVGFDAHLAGIFNAGRHRGPSAYVASVVREVLTYRPRRYVLRAGDATLTERALVVAVANTRQYGNRALIAPLARPDDGLLEIVLLPAMSLPSILWHARRLFTGTVHRVRGVRMFSLREAEIGADEPIAFHVDGEVATGDKRLRIKVHPCALAVKVPRAW